MNPVECERRHRYLMAWLAVNGYSLHEYNTNPAVKCEADTYLGKVMAELNEPNP